VPAKYHWNVIADFAEQYGWKLGVELGVRAGANVKYLLENTELEVVGVDLMQVQPGHNAPGEEDYAHWPWEEYNHQVDMLVNRFPERFTMWRMDTTEVSQLYPDRHFDFVFIDADHSYTGVLNDIRHWAPKVKMGGIVMGHDIDRGEHFVGVRKAAEECFKAVYTQGEEWNYVWWAFPDEYIDG
jgi:hypothetical protein